MLRTAKPKIKTPLQALVNAGFRQEEAKTIHTYKGDGCKTCNGTGYKGRIGMYEVMEIRRGHSGTDPGRRLRPGDKAQGGGGRDADSSSVRTVKDKVRAHHPRRGFA